MSVIVIYPHHDVPTTISSFIADDLIQWARKRGIKVLDIYAMRAIRPALYSAMLFTPANLICYYGHGSKWSLLGQVPPSGLIKRDNVDWFGEKIVFTLACYSAQGLGPLAMRTRTRTYFGSEEVMYCAFPEGEHNYMEDLTHAINAIPKALIEGATCGEAFERYQETMRYYIDLYEEKEAVWPNADWYAHAFKMNLDYYRLIGDPNLRLADVPAQVIRAPYRPPRPPLDVRAIFGGLGLVSAAVLAAPVVYDVGKREGWW